MPRLADAIHDLRAALRAPAGDAQAEGWGWTVRQRMSQVRDALVSEPTGVSDAWLSARSGTVVRDRNRLVSRLSDLGPVTLESHDADRVRIPMQRLLVDLEHHRQRVNDLAYDSVAMELGGSE